MAGITPYISSYLGIIYAAAASVSRPKSFFSIEGRGGRTVAQ